MQDELAVAAAAEGMRRDAITEAERVGRRALLHASTAAFLAPARFGTSGEAVVAWQLRERIAAKARKRDDALLVPGGSSSDHLGRSSSVASGAGSTSAAVASDFAHCSTFHAQEFFDDAENGAATPSGERIAAAALFKIKQRFVATSSCRSSPLLLNGRVASTASILGASATRVDLAATTAPMSPSPPAQPVVTEVPPPPAPQPQPEPQTSMLPVKEEEEKEEVRRNSQVLSTPPSPPASNSDVADIVDIVQRLSPLQNAPPAPPAPPLSRPIASASVRGATAQLASGPNADMLEKVRIIFGFDEARARQEIAAAAATERNALESLAELTLSELRQREDHAAFPSRRMTPLRAGPIGMVIPATAAAIMRSPHTQRHTLSSTPATAARALSPVVGGGHRSPLQGRRVTTSPLRASKLQ